MVANASTSDAWEAAATCARHGESRHELAECLECAATTPNCAGPNDGCSGLGDPDPAAHDRKNCLVGRAARPFPMRCRTLGHKLVAIGWDGTGDQIGCARCLYEEPDDQDRSERE